MLKVYHVYFQKREEWNWQSVSKCDYMKEKRKDEWKPKRVKLLQSTEYKPGSCVHGFSNVWIDNRK